jgi:hypothetical protein
MVNVAFHELRDEYRRSAYDRRRREAAAKTKAAVEVRTAPPRTQPTPQRPAQNNFRMVYHSFSMHPSLKSPHKKRALLGGLIAATAASVVAIVFLFISNDSFQLQSPTYTLQPGGAVASAVPSSALSVTAAAVNTTQIAAAGDLTKQQLFAVEQVYQQRLNSVIDDAENTLATTDATAVNLENQGDSDSASDLRRDSRSLEVKLIQVGDEVKLLGKAKKMSVENNLEAHLNGQLEMLRNGNKQLIAEVQNMRQNNQAVADPANGSAQDVPPVQDTSPNQPTDATP